MSDDFIIIRDSDTKSETVLKNDLTNQLTSNIDKIFASKAVSKTHFTKFNVQLKVIYFHLIYLLNIAFILKRNKYMMN